MPGSDPLAVLQRLAACWEHGDAEAAASLFAPDATYSEPPLFAFAGREAIRAFFADFAARHHDVSFRVVRALVQPLSDPRAAIVAAEWRFAHTRTADGARKVYEGMSWINWIDVDGGLITRWRGFSAPVGEPSGQ
jgi:uncharacterized protein (TIGR02246 family)